MRKIILLLLLLIICQYSFAIEFTVKNGKIDNTYKYTSQPDTINIPEGATEWDDFRMGITTLFNSKMNIKVINIPSTLKTFKNIERIYYPNLTNINVNKNNKYYKSYVGCLYNNNYTKLLKVPLKSSYCPSFHDNITSIGKGAFYGCADIKYIELPNNIKVIEDNTFENCENLKEIYIGDKVTKIGKEAFSNCYKLQYIRWSPSVNIIGERAFAGCYNLRIVDIPKSVNSIGEGAFADCDALKYISAPKGLDISKTDYPQNCEITFY
ncbi:MAG: leucine-rich repeat domain-containing protein [Abditibacteriota bacterium]|nr:leucine-rich repeat domain-containing protein [Abditibacteriota bacterium]